MKQRLSSSAYLGFWLAVLSALTTHAQSLLNVDFGGSAVSPQTGPAGVRLGSNDGWNAYSHYLPRLIPGMAAVPNGRLEALKFADGAPSQVTISVTNAPGVWGNATGDGMFDSYIFAPNGSNIMVNITGLEGGRYQFYLYGHAAADVTAEQNSVFTLRTSSPSAPPLGPLASAGAAGWRAGQPWMEGRQFVVFRDVAVATGETVLIETAPGPGGVAVLNGLQILSRGTAPPRLVSPLPLAAATRITNLLFREIQYVGVLGSDDARFKVQVGVESRSRDPVSAVLFEGDLAVLSPKLPMGWRMENRGRQFVLTADEPGDHRLELEVAAKVTRTEPWNVIDFAGPPAAIANVSVQANSPDTEIQFTRGMVLESGSTNKIGVRGVLAADQRVALRWQSKAAEVARDAVVAVDTHTNTRITPSVIRQTTTFRYDVHQGRLGKVTIALPSGHVLTKLSGEAVREWKLVPGVDGQTLSVEFLRPVETTTTLTLLSEQSINQLPTSLTLAVAQPAGVQRENGAVSLVVEDVVVRVDEAVGLRQVNSSPEELAAYRFNARPLSLRLSLARVEPEVQVAARVFAILEESRLLVRHELGFTVRRAGIYSLNLTVPAGLAVSEVVGNGVEDWRVVEGVLRIGFGHRVMGDRTVSVQLEQALVGTPPQLNLVPLRVTGASKESAFIGARTMAGLSLKTTALEVAREIPVAALPTPSGDLLAYRADSGNWRVTLGAERLTSRLVAEVFNLITVGDGLVGGSATIRLAIANQGLATFRVQLPKHWRNVEFTGANLRRVDRQDDVWTLTLQDKAWGVYTLLVTYDASFDPKTAILDAAGAHPLGTEGEVGTVAVTAAPGLAVRASAVVEPLRVIDTTELSPTDRAFITRPVLFAGRYDGTNFALNLNITRHEQIEVRDAVADRAQLTSVLTEHGEMLTQAAFMVKNNERQFQRFQLPTGASLWGVAVNGDPVKAERDGDWVLVSLPRGDNRDQAFAVNLVYEQPLGALARLGGLWPRSLELVAPKTDVPGTYAEWELYTPPSQRVAGFDGNMTIARGTTYGLRDGWEEFLRVYRSLWHDYGAALIITLVIGGFVVSVWVLGRRDGFGGLVQVLVLFGFLAVLAGMLLPALSKAKSKAQRISSVNNLKQIGLAARQFSLDHNGRMPADFAEMRSELGNGDKVLVHPFTGERYFWVGAGKSEENPEDILAYSGNVGGLREVLLADGSVQQVSENRFNEMLKAEAAATVRRNPDVATTSAPAPARLDPKLAARYGLSVGQARAGAFNQLDTAADSAMPTANGSGPTAGAAPAPGIAGLRSLKIEVPRSGRAWQFTRVLNLGGEPPSIRLSVMSSKAFVLLRSAFQLIALFVGLALAGWQWGRAEPKSLWLAVGVGLALVAITDVLIAWRALHLVLIVSGPALLVLILGWTISRRWARRGTELPPNSPASPIGPAPGLVYGAGVVGLLLLTSIVHPPFAVADVSFAAPAVSVVSASYTGTAHERVAQLEAKLEFNAVGTNQIAALFGPEVAVQAFAATSGDVRLWREGERVGVLLPLPGAATATLSLLVKLGGDAGRRTLDFGLPSALGTRLSLLLAEPDAEVEFPGAIALNRSSAGAQTQIEAVLGATARLSLAWTPRLKRVTESEHAVFAEQVSLVKFGNGVVALRSILDFTTPQGELRSVRVALPAGQRLLRVGGDQVRGWDYVGTNRNELVLSMLKSAARVRAIFETEITIDQLPASIAVVLPRPLDVKRASGQVAICDGEELGLSVERTEGLERIEVGAFGKALGEEITRVVSAWHFQRPDFALAVKAEVLTPKLDVTLRQHFTVGFDQLSVSAHADVAVTRAGVFAVRFALPSDARVEAVVCDAMQSWNERTDGGHELELSLKQRTLGVVSIDVTLVGPQTNLPPLLNLVGLHPLGADKLTGFVSVAAEPGLSLKAAALRGLTEIPAATLPGGPGKSGVLAFKMLPINPGPVANWLLQMAAETIESWVRAEVASAVLVGESLVSGRSVVRYDIQNAPIKEFRVRVPSAWRHVEIQGAGIRRRDQSVGAAQTEWRVELQNKVRGDYSLTVHWDEPRSTTNPLTVAGLEVPGVERETGTVTIFTQAQLQLVPGPLGEDLLRIDARELPAWAARLGPGAPVLSYRYLRPGWKLALEVQRFSDAVVLQALIEKAQLRTVVADDGQMMTQIELSIRNNGRQHLEFALPPGAVVWSAFVDGEAVRPAKKGDKLLLPLEGTRGAEASVSAELTYVGTMKFPRSTGRVNLDSPRFDVPLKDAHWEVFLPPDHTYHNFGGTMTYVSADLVPVAQDFTLASYRRQEIQKADELASQAIEFIGQTRKQVAEGNYDNAGKLGLFRSRALRNDVVTEELKALEEAVSRTQNSNFAQAQRNYALNNALQSGASQTPSSADPATNAAAVQLAEITGRQVTLLNRAQKVTETQVTPLRVNLPTRGIRHVFAQVLQTEINKPLNVTFHAENERRTSWWTLTWQLSLGFAALWAAATVAAFFRPIRNG